MGALCAIFFTAFFLFYYRKKKRLCSITPSSSSDGSKKDLQVERERYVKITNLEKKHDDDLVRQSTLSNHNLSAKSSEIICYEDDVQTNVPSQSVDTRNLSHFIKKYFKRKVQHAPPKVTAKHEENSKQPIVHIAADEHSARDCVLVQRRQELPALHITTNEDSVKTKSVSVLLPMEKYSNKRRLPPLNEHTVHTENTDLKLGTMQL